MNFYLACEGFGALNKSSTVFSQLLYVVLFIPLYSLIRPWSTREINLTIVYRLLKKLEQLISCNHLTFIVYKKLCVFMCFRYAVDWVVQFQICIKRYIKLLDNASLIGSWRYAVLLLR